VVQLARRFGRPVAPFFFNGGNMQAIDLCNLALGLAGDDGISAFQDNTPMAAFCAQQYPAKRNDLLGKYRWEFANRVVPLARIDPSGLMADRMVAANAFEKPSDIIGVINDYRDQAQKRGARPVYVIEADNRLWADAGAVWAEYTALVDESRWPSWFVELFKYAFAADISRRLQNVSQAREFSQTAFGTPQEQGQGGLFAAAIQADARGAPQRQMFGMDAGELVNVRYDGGNPFCGGFSGPITTIDF
jgi:hypothetical protein